MSASTRYGMLDIQAFLSQFYVNPNTGQSRQLVITPYAYPASFTNLTAGLTATANVNISSNADFVVFGLSHRAVTDVDTGQTVSTKTAPMVRVLITDSGTGEQFTSQAVDLENYSSNGNAFYELPYPRVLTGKSSLQVQVTNFSSGDSETEYQTLEILFHGVQVRAY